MSEGFDKTLYELAEEANRELDFDALKMRVLAAREMELQKDASTQKSAAPETPVHKLRPNAAKFRTWGLMAACLLLCIAAGSIALRGGEFRAKDSAQEDVPEMLNSAPTQGVEAPQASAADMPQLAMAAAPEAPAAAAPEAMAEGEGKSAQEDAADAGMLAMGRAAQEDAAQKDDVLLVNRSHPLPEGWEAENLVSVDAAALPNIKLKKEGMMADAAALSALAQMLSAAEDEGVTGFYLSSAYRSYEEQAAIWANKLAHEPDYGQNGRPVSSMAPGESEHQTGLAFDVSCLAHPSLSAGYADTEQAKWLAANCASYGFILRYPEGKEAVTGVVFEPWHFRYVGTELALYLTENGLTLEEGQNNE